MKNTLVFLATTAAIGILAGAAVGYWEARPWAANTPAVAASSSAADPHAGHNHAKTDDAADPDDPKGVAPETKFNFGRMEVGGVQRHTFPLTNEGGGPLTVNYVSHTCKCTKVARDGEPIEPGVIFTLPPGGKSEIMLEWVAAAAGPFRHGAAFTTSDNKFSRLEFTVEGDVVASTTLEPSRLDFGPIHIGKKSQTEMVVMTFTEPTVEILSHEVLDEKFAEHVTIAIEPLRFDQLPNPQAKAAVKIVATYEPHGTLGPFLGSLVLKTNLKQAPDHHVAIVGTVKGDVSIFGPAWNEEQGLLRMAPVRSAEGGASKLDVYIRGEHAPTTELNVKSVEPKELKVELGERENFRDNLIRVPLVVTIPPGTRPMTRMGDELGGEAEIVLSTTHPDTDSIRLRVYFTVQP